MQNKDTPILLPAVNSYQPRQGVLNCTTPIQLQLPDDLNSLTQCVLHSFRQHFTIGDESIVRFVINQQCQQEGYVLDISDDIAIEYSHPSGAFYALMTLRQLLLNGTVAKCKITDFPKLTIRGYMLDVSRGKIPTMQSLMALADMLASFKINHLQLYFEGSPFVYNGYEQYAQPDAYTPEQMCQFDNYCRQRHIQLVPNLNTLGHMSYWLNKDQFRHLAECQEGFQLNGYSVPPTTLDCTNPESMQLVVNLIDGLTPCYASNSINVGLDEPFEIGKGKNSTKDVATIFVDYVNALHQQLANRTKTMMMWDDVVFQHSHLAKQLNNDIVLLDWGYQAEYPFQKRAKTLWALNKKFLLCPGTSSWNSVAGMTDNMLVNISNATQAAHQYGAMGVILTDWGDGGHIQHTFVSYPAILWAAALTWSDSYQQSLATALDVLVFCDSSRQLGSLVLDMGRYCQYEERMLECRTMISIPLQFPNARGEQYNAIEQGLMQLTLKLIPLDLTEIYRNKMQQYKTFDWQAFDNYIRQLRTRLRLSRPQCADGDIIMAEIDNTIQLVVALQQARSKLRELTTDKALANKIRRIASVHKRLFLVRNRPSGIDNTLNTLNALADNLVK